MCVMISALRLGNRAEMFVGSKYILLYLPGLVITHVFHHTFFGSASVVAGDYSRLSR